MEEIWKAVSGFANYYEVSNLGRIKRRAGTPKCRKDRILKLGSCTAGYAQVQLCVDGKKEALLVHRLVAEAFLGKCPERYDVNHKDGDRLNNIVSNLEYLTRSQNQKHAYDVLGRKWRGYHKLQVEDVIQIRHLLSIGITTNEIARRYSVTGTTIYSIHYNKSWKHVPISESLGMGAK